MPTFSTILMDLNGSGNSDRIFDYASFIAQKSGSKLLILHVLEEFATVGHSISQELRVQSKELLKRYEIKAHKLGLRSVDMIESQGNDAAIEILKTAESKLVDTIVIGSRGPTASTEFLLGSTSYKVTHYAECTVVLVK
jgi:nucleotide-binding universal stress UspA family protein